MSEFKLRAELSIKNQIKLILDIIEIDLLKKIDSNYSETLSIEDIEKLFRTLQKNHDDLPITMCKDLLMDLMKDDNYSDESSLIVAEKITCLIKAFINLKGWQSANDALREVLSHFKDRALVSHYLLKSMRLVKNNLSGYKPDEITPDAKTEDISIAAADVKELKKIANGYMFDKWVKKEVGAVVIAEFNKLTRNDPVRAKTLLYTPFEFNHLKNSKSLMFIMIQRFSFMALKHNFSTFQHYLQSCSEETLSSLITATTSSYLNYDHKLSWLLNTFIADNPDRLILAMNSIARALHPRNFQDNEGNFISNYQNNFVKLEDAIDKFRAGLSAENVAMLNEKLGICYQEWPKLELDKLKKSSTEFQKKIAHSPTPAAKIRGKRKTALPERRQDHKNTQREKQKKLEKAITGIHHNSTTAERGKTQNTYQQDSQFMASTIPMPFFSTDYLTEEEAISLGLTSGLTSTSDLLSKSGSTSSSGDVLPASGLSMSPKTLFLLENFSVPEDFQQTLPQVLLQAGSAPQTTQTSQSVSLGASPTSAYSGTFGFFAAPVSPHPCLGSLQQHTPNVTSASQTSAIDENHLPDSLNP